MSILRGLQKRAADPTLPWGSSIIPRNDEIGRAAAGLVVNDTTALSVTTVATCVSILADDVSTLPLVVYRRTSDHSKKVVDPAPPIVSNPWPEGTLQDWLSQVMFSIALRGNFYGQLLARDDRGWPTVCQPIHPDYIVPSRNPSSGFREYRVNGTLLPAENVLHIPSSLLPPGTFVGLNPVEYARASWGLAAAAEQYGGQFFANSANPSGVISVPEDLSEEETLEMSRAWLMAHRGIGNARLPAVLTGGASWQQITMTMDDAQFLATRQFQQLDIAAFFRVPIHRLGVVDRTTSLAGLEQLETSYLTGTLRPYLERIESYLSRQLPANLICKFDLSGRLRGDTSQRYAAYVQGWQTGFLNQDEIRAMEDLPPMPNGLGQTYYGPLNFAPLGTPRAPVNTTGPTVGQGVGGAVGASSGDQTGPNDAAQQNKAAEEMILRILAEAGHSV